MRNSWGTQSQGSPLPFHGVYFQESHQILLVKSQEISPVPLLGKGKTTNFKNSPRTFTITKVHFPGCKTLPEPYLIWGRACIQLLLFLAILFCLRQGGKPRNIGGVHSSWTQTILRLQNSLPPTHLTPLPTYKHQQDSSIITVGQSWKICKTFTVSEEFLGKLKDNKGDKSKDSNSIWSLQYVRLQKTLNTAQLLERLNIKPHTKGLVTQFLLSDTLCLTFSQKITSHAKWKEKTYIMKVYSLQEDIFIFSQIKMGLTKIPLLCLC